MRPRLWRHAPWPPYQGRKLRPKRACNSTFLKKSPPATSMAAGSEKLLVMKTSVLPDSGSLEADAPQKFGVILTGVEAVQGDGLVANDAGRAIRRRRIDAMSIDVRLGTRDEEGPGLVRRAKSTYDPRRRWLRLPARAYRGRATSCSFRDVDKPRMLPRMQRVHLHRRGADSAPTERPTGTSDGRRVQWRRTKRVCRGGRLDMDELADCRRMVTQHSSE